MQAITQSMNPDYSYTPIGFEADIYVGSSLEGLTDTALIQTTTDIFTIGFDKPGTYYVVAKDPSGTHETPRCCNGNGQFRSVCLCQPLGGRGCDERHAGNFIVHYPMVLQEGDTINDILTELHALRVR
jgi:hypothetical protein